MARRSLCQRWHSQRTFFCTYDTLDRAISQLKVHGKGALTSKLDLSDAFRHILVRSQDWELLGSTWQVDIDGSTTTAYFVDAFCPFDCAAHLRFSSITWIYYHSLCGTVEPAPFGIICRRGDSK